MVEHRQRFSSNGGKQSHTGDPGATPPLDPPADPKTIEDAREYLSWIARQSISGALGHNQAQAATRAIMSWVKAEDYARQIRDIKKQIADLKKAEKGKRP